MKNKNIKLIKMLSLLTLFSAFAGLACAALPSTVAYGWFFKKSENGCPPPEPAEFSFIEKYGGKWLDKNASEKDKVIYLTFDAGYENGNVKRVLDALDKEGVKGTFFILENLINREPDLVKRMFENGHTVANHTAKHPDMSKICDKKIFKKQLTDLEDKCREKLGFEVSKYFRPPEGRFSEMTLDYLNSLGYKTVFWSFAYADWDNDHQPAPEMAKEKILKATHNGMVLLLHPTSGTNAEILPELITEWKKMGYRFGTMDELFEK